MRKVFFILTALVVVVLIGVVIVISQVDVSQYKAQALAEVEKATGRKASIDGDVDLSISLTPAIVAEGVRFANASWGSRPDMATIKRIEVQVALLPLLRNAVEVQRFILIEPDVLLEKNAQGKGNWELATAKASSQKQDSPADTATINIGTVLVKQLKLEYRDAGAEKPRTIAIDTLKLDPMGADQLGLELQAELENTPVNVNGSIGSLKRLFANNAYPLALQADIGAAKVTLKGEISKPLLGKGLKLAATLNVAKLDELNSLAGSELPAMGPLALSAQLSDAEAVYRLSDLKLTLGDINLSGEISVNTKGKLPYLDATLRAAMLDLVPFQADPATEQDKVERYFTDEPLPLDGIKTLNADIALQVDEVRTRQATLSKFNATIKLNDGRLDVKPLSMSAVGGTLNGSISLDATKKPSPVSVELEGKDIQLGQLPALQDRLGEGPTDFSIRIKGSGNSTRAIAASADGKLLVKVGKASLKREAKKEGFLASLGKLINPFSAEDNAALECAVINFAIKDGIATANRGIGVQTKQVTVSGSGDINLGNEKLALGFEPHATGTIAGGITNLAAGMKVGGTLADPKVTINPAGVAMGAIKSVAGGTAGAIVGGLFGKNDSGIIDSAPCQTALTGKPTPAKTPQARTPGKVESITKEVLDAPKKLLKGLFD